MKLKDYLKRHNIAPATFAAQLSVSGEAVRLWLNGERIPNEQCMASIGAKTDWRVRANDFYAPAPPKPYKHAVASDKGE